MLMQESIIVTNIVTIILCTYRVNTSTLQATSGVLAGWNCNLTCWARRNCCKFKRCKDTQTVSQPAPDKQSKIESKVTSYEELTIECAQCGLSCGDYVSVEEPGKGVCTMVHKKLGVFR